MKVTQMRLEGTWLKSIKDHVAALALETIKIVGILDSLKALRKLAEGSLVLGRHDCQYIRNHIGIVTGIIKKPNYIKAKRKFENWREKTQCIAKSDARA